MEFSGCGSFWIVDVFGCGPSSLEYMGTEELAVFLGRNVESRKIDDEHTFGVLVG